MYNLNGFFLSVLSAGLIERKIGTIESLSKYIFMTNKIPKVITL